MQNPKKKKINKLTPSILYTAIIQYLLAFQGDFFDKFRNCPHCGSSNCKKHHIEEDKLFCKVIINGKFKDITVAVQIFYCNDCHKTYLAKSPFYDGPLYCQPVVDLCLYLSAKNPYHRVEKILLELGIQVDRDTVKNYALRFEGKIKKCAGMELFGEVGGINLLKVMFDVENVKELNVITTGSLPPNPSELFMSQRMELILEKLENAADVIIIDSPPLMAVTDAAVLAPRVDGVLMVAKPGVTKVRSFHQSVNQVNKVGGNLVGVVMSDITDKGMRSRYYKNNYYYQYQDYYGESSRDR